MAPGRLPGCGGSQCASPRDPENPSGPTAGLDYRYFESAANDNWCSTSSLNGQTPVKTGTVTNFSLNPRNKDEYFGFEFTGYLQVTTQGEYTFYFQSDDAGRFMIGSQTVVSYEGCHGMTPEQSGGHFKLVSQGSTDGTKIGYVLGVRNQGGSENDIIDLQVSASGDHQLWSQTALTGTGDENRFKIERKGTAYRIGSVRNWGQGNLSDGESDLALVSDPGDVFGFYKWAFTQKTCPNP